jgi:hypothetical protein
MQEARVVWQTAASVADPSSDLGVIVEIQDALNGTTDHQNGSSDASATAATPRKAGESGRDSAVVNFTASNGPSTTAQPLPSVTATPAAKVPAPAPLESASASKSSKSSIHKGFLGPSTGASKGSSAAGAVKIASATNSNRSSSSSADAVVEIDCVAEQQQGSQGPAAGSFGAQVQQMAQNSVALQIAINQVGCDCRMASPNTPLVAPSIYSHRL